MVEHKGFEPLTSSMPWKRASQLRQCPVSKDNYTMLRLVLNWYNSVMSKTSNSAKASGGKSQRKLTALFVVAAVLIFGLSGWAWWHNVRSNPERTLYAAIENSFRTRSLTRQVVQENGPQKLAQDIELGLSPQPVAHGYTTITQTGSVDASVKTEVISTKSEEFVRYTEIQTNQKNGKGKQLDFAELLNIWGKTSSGQTGQPGELYGESVLGVVPTANLKARDRQTLMKIVKDNDIYKFDQKTLQRKIENGRPVYVYDVTVVPSAYISLLKEFGGIVGLEQLKALDPKQYEGSEPLTFKLTVDVWSQRLTGIEFSGGARTERMSSFGINHDVDVPKDSIPVEELQSKLQKAQE
jgi:hypothetical protein